MPEKIKKTNIKECPFYDIIFDCSICRYYDNEKGKKENCPYHENQNYYSQKRKLLMLEKIKLNSEFGKLAKNLKGEKKNV